MLMPPPPVMPGGSKTGMRAVGVVIADMAFRVILGCVGALAFGSTMAFREVAGRGGSRRVVCEDNVHATKASAVLTPERAPGGHFDM